MTLFALGRAAHVLVAPFALVMERVLGFGSGGIDTVAGRTGEFVTFDTLVVTLGAVVNLALVSGVREGDGPHFAAFELDLGRTVVGNGKHSGTGNNSNNTQQNDHFLHDFLLRDLIE
jgi:hypothetical protein